MTDSSGEFITPPETPSSSMSLPESAERESIHDEVTVVFGQGPIKPVLLYEELTSAQQEEWETFSQNPLHSKEPEFRIIPKADRMNIDRIRSKIETSQQDPSLTAEEKLLLQQTYEQQIKDYRDRLQHNPRLALHRYGRIVALAAGASLMEGTTDNLILSGGKTIPKWAQADGENPVSEGQRKNWPSEAQLMREQVIQVFGKRYREKYGKNIEDVLHIEDSSPTTIHNFAFALERYKSLLSTAKGISFLSTDVHLPRIMALAELTVDHQSPQNTIDAQKTLETRARTHKKQLYETLVKYTHDIEENPIAQERAKKEDTLIKELTDPKVIAFWELSGKYNPELHETILRVLGKGVGTGWEAKASEILAKCGLDYNNFSLEYIDQKISQGELSNEQYDQIKHDIKALADSFPNQYSAAGTAAPVSKKDV